jgi:hypothetical protein
MEEEPNVLWAALQTHYEQQKVVILPEVNHDWTMLRLQDFKSIGKYNHDVHKICAKLHFCEKEPSEVDKIEKILQTKCFLQIESCNINIVPRITKLTQILFMISFK